MLRHLLLLLPATLLMASTPAGAPVPAPAPAAPCQFGRGAPIPDGSSWADQFKCYQSSGRQVSIAGSGSFESGTVSGGVCVTGVSADRVQVAACGSFAGDGAMIIAYAAIAYVIDDPRNPAANVYLTPLFRH